MIEFQPHPKTVLVWVTLVIYQSFPHGNRRASRLVQWLCVVRTVTCVAVTRTVRVTNPEGRSSGIVKPTVISGSPTWAEASWANRYSAAADPIQVAAGHLDPDLPSSSAP